MANTIKIKRSLLSAAPSSLAEGELAYVFGTDTLYIGAPGSTMIIIAGASTYAKLLSPAFTGTPTAPTATSGTNTTQIATTAFVAAAVAGGGVTIDSVPTNGSTNAVSSDGTFDALALKADINSPTFTGTPAAPTAANATNSTQIATTAFVKAVINDLLNGAGAAYDTLKEIQDLMEADDTAFSGLVTTVSGKLTAANDLSDLNDPATARTNLGLGTMAEQDHTAVNIDGGDIDGVTLDGGTF